MRSLMAEAFAEAAERRPDELVTELFCFAGMPVRMRVVGRDLAARLRAPFAHLADPTSAESDPLLTLDVWDGHVTGVSCPVDPDASTFVERDINGTRVLWEPADVNRVVTATDGALSELDRRAERIVGWRAGGTEMTLEEQAKPFPILLPAWYLGRSVATLHAGMVADDGRGVLVVGEGGRGKSTTTLACTAAGFTFVGDDHIGISLGTTLPVVHSQYASARLDAAQLARISRADTLWSVHPARHNGGKSLVLLPGSAARSAVVRAVVVPAVTDRTESRLSAASAREALLALAPSTIYSLLTDRAATFEGCARAVGDVPVYRLELGQDLKAVPALVKQALAGAV